MRIIEESRWSWSAPWARRCAVLSLAVAVVAIAAHWLLLLETPAFFWSLVTASTLAVLAVLLAGLAMPRIWYYGYRGGRDVVKAFLVSAVVLVPACFALFLALTTPRLADISTDLDEPPAFVEALAARGPGTNAVGGPSDRWRDLQGAEYPEVAGRRYEMPIENVRAAVEATMQEYGWPVLGPSIIGTGSRFNIETLVYSPVLALPSDVVVRLVEDGDSTFVDMRSTSRYGDRDFGLNAGLVTGFLKELDAQVATLTPAAPQE
ncbi:MAG: DUF1499 domain-containing protein [Rhizobiaceae bacterium]|nr:DUF1499 domain-containing protein [Rhizobiaceae bacterium]